MRLTAPLHVDARGRPAVGEAKLHIRTLLLRERHEAVLEEELPERVVQVAGGVDARVTPPGVSTIEVLELGLRCDETLDPLPDDHAVVEQQQWSERLVEIVCLVELLHRGPGERAEVSELRAAREGPEVLRPQPGGGSVVEEHGVEALVGVSSHVEKSRTDASDRAARELALPAIDLLPEDDPVL
jgi:hypothetical protein